MGATATQTSYLTTVPSNSCRQSPQTLQHHQVAQMLDNLAPSSSCNGDVSVRAPESTHRLTWLPAGTCGERNLRGCWARAPWRRW